MAPRTRKRLHIVLYVIAGILLCAGLFTLWLSSNYRSILQRKLPAWTASSTDSLYLLNYENITFRILQSRIELENLTLAKDTLQVERLEASHTMPGKLFTLSIPRMEITGVNWMALFFRKKLSCSRMVVFDPTVGIASVHDSMQVERLPKELSPPHITARHVEMIRPSLTVVEGDRDSSHWETGGGSVLLGNFALYPHLENDTIRMLYEIGSLRLDSLLLKRTNGFYTFHTGPISFSEKDEEYTLRNVRLKLALSREAFYARVGEQAEIYEMNFPYITIDQPDFQSLVFGDAIRAKRVRLSDATLDIYLNRIPPPTGKSKLGYFPNQVLLKQDIPILIDTIDIRNGYVRYTELSYETRREAEIVFTGIQGWISNVTNIPERIDSNHVCRMSMRAKTFGDTDIKGTFAFFLNDKSGAFEVTGYQEAVDGRKTNEAAKALSLAEFESFNVHSLNMAVSGDENGAKGRLTLRYNDLKVRLLKMEGRQIEEKVMSTFMVKNLFLYPDNPMPGKDVRIAEVTWARDPYKSFFNMLWKVLLSGAMHTAIRDGIGEDIVKNVLEKPAEKDAARRRHR